ncbi:MAG: hypothetical protein ACE5FN_03780 [Leptospirillia bacterium]
MSGSAILFFACIAGASLWGIYIGLRGCLAEAPPFMQGEGGHARYDSRMRDAA